MSTTIANSGRRGRKKRALDAEPRAPSADPDSWEKAPGRVTILSHPFTLAMLSGLLLAAAFPPFGLWPLAWAAPIGWLLLVRAKSLPGRRPYLWIYAAGTIHWLIVVQFIRLPHWAGWLGWPLLSMYFAAYPTLFVAVSRAAVHRMRVPMMLAAPLVWVGMEVLRGYMLTGFSMALLAHSQVAWPAIIQVADIFGGYGLSFLMVFAAACATMMLPPPREGKAFLPGLAGAAPSRYFGETSRLKSAVGRLWPAVPLGAALGAALIYGHVRLDQTPPDEGPPLKVAIVQGSVDTVFAGDLETMQRMRRQYAQYLESTQRACREHDDLDMIVWPESMFMVPDPIDGRRGDSFMDSLLGHLDGSGEERFHMEAIRNKAIAARIVDERHYDPTPMLVGSHSYRTENGRLRMYNSALLIGPEGQVEDRYLKMHRVMFGEYIPLGELAPWIYALSPLPEGLAAGDEPKSFEVKGMRFSPNICYESTVPHLIQRQLAELERRGEPADVVVNLSNDGWFWGSNALDLHLACNVFRAVENRRPVIVAANTGISAHIDGNGRIIQRGPRRRDAVLIAEVRGDGRRGLFQFAGDLPAWACTFFCLAAAVIGWRGRKKSS